MRTDFDVFYAEAHEITVPTIDLSSFDGSLTLIFETLDSTTDVWTLSGTNVVASSTDLTFTLSTTLTTTTGQYKWAAKNGNSVKVFGYVNVIYAPLDD